MNHKRPGRRRREERRNSAMTRKFDRAQRGDKMQLIRIRDVPGQAKRERARLEARIKSNLIAESETDTDPQKV